MITDILPKKSLKQINDSLYALVEAKKLIELLEEAGEDTAEFVAAAEHLERNLTAYKRAIEGRGK